MVNPALNAALIAAAGKQKSASAGIVEQLRKAGATSARKAVLPDLSEEGAADMLAWLLRRGHLREAGGGRYWLDLEAVAASKARALRASLLVAAFLLSAAASLLALTAA
jgi:hypothetical protein